MNNIKLHKIVFLCTAFVAMIGNAQVKQIIKANKKFNEYSYIDARKTFMKVLERGYESQDLLQKIADSYYFNGDLDESVKWYDRLYTKYSDKVGAEYLFRYSQALKSVKDYAKADEIMKKFEEIQGSEEKRVELFNAEKNYLDKIELQSGRFNIKNLSNINTESSDFGPSFYGSDKMIFASTRDNNPLTKVIHEWNEVNYLDLYETNRLDGTRSGMVEGLEKFSGKINSKFHESTPVFTKDGKTVYFTRNNYTDGTVRADKKGTTLLKLYKASVNNGVWSNAIELPFNDDQYSVAHPALSPDETKLYFASDMPGTKGLSDIFYVDINGSSYGDPVNLGGDINTEGRETFPFISESGTLFFASDGHPGLGGLDVFLTLPKENEEGQYSFPMNIGRPINSPDDDFSFIIDESTNLGFFTSNRDGGVGDDDIYSLEQIKELILKCEQTVKGPVVDALTNDSIEGATVVLYDADMNKIESFTSDADGNYVVTEPINCSEKYILRASKQGYKPFEMSFESNDELDKENVITLKLEPGFSPIPPGEQKFKVGDDLAKILQINNIYFDLDKYFIRPDAEVELQKILIVLEEYPNMEIDVRSHTDSRASFMYNYKLSNNRADSSVEYLVSKGVSPDRLEGRGYGEIRPVNECVDGVKCTEAQHQMNRRSEFIITKL